MVKNSASETSGPRQDNVTIMCICKIARLFYLIVFMPFDFLCFCLTLIFEGYTETSELLVDKEN